LKSQGRRTEVVPEPQGLRRNVLPASLGAVLKGLVLIHPEKEKGTKGSRSIVISVDRDRGERTPPGKNLLNVS